MRLAEAVVSCHYDPAVDDAADENNTPPGHENSPLPGQWLQQDSQLRLASLLGDAVHRRMADGEDAAVDVVACGVEVCELRREARLGLRDLGIPGRSSATRMSDNQMSNWIWYHMKRKLIFYTD